MTHSMIKSGILRSLPRVRFFASNPTRCHPHPSRRRGPSSPAVLPRRLAPGGRAVVESHRPLPGGPSPSPRPPPRSALARGTSRRLYVRRQLPEIVPLLQEVHLRRMPGRGAPRLEALRILTADISLNTVLLLQELHGWTSLHILPALKVLALPVLSTIVSPRPQSSRRSRVRIPNSIRPTFSTGAAKHEELIDRKSGTGPMSAWTPASRRTVGSPRSWPYYGATPAFAETSPYMASAAFLAAPDNMKRYRPLSSSTSATRCGTDGFTTAV